MSEPTEAAGRADTTRLKLRVPAVPDSLETLLEAMEGVWAEDASISMRDQMRFSTALMEILGNVIEHAYAADVDLDGIGGPGDEGDPGDPGDPSRHIDVVVEIDAARLVAVIEDDGQPVGLDLSEAVMPDAEAESGRGLALALASLDHLGYEREGDRNRWTLECRR